jgi:hypothetical protein
LFSSFAVLVYPLVDRSPLRGLSLESLQGSDPEVVCRVTAADKMFAQTV